MLQAHTQLCTESYTSTRSWHVQLSIGMLMLIPVDTAPSHDDTANSTSKSRHKQTFEEWVACLLSYGCLKSFELSPMALFNDFWVSRLPFGLKLVMQTQREEALINEWIWIVLDSFIMAASIFQSRTSCPTTNLTRGQRHSHLSNTTFVAWTKSRN